MLKPPCNMEDIDFFKPQQKPLGQTIKIYNEHSKLSDKSIILSGFPYDLGTKISGQRLGAAKGPQIFRQSLLTYDLVQKNKITIYDAGNIPNTFQTIAQAHQQLTHKHKTIFEIQDQNKANCCIFSLGGSHDQCLANINSLIERYPGKKIGLILIDSHVDCESEQKTQLSDENYLSQMLRSAHSDKINVTAFGINQISNFFKETRINISYMQSQIRNIQSKQIKESGLKTQVGTAFKWIVESVQKQADILMISFDVKAIQSKWMPGVSKPNVNIGLSNLETFQVMKIAGKSSKIKLFEISNFNPSIQSKFSAVFLNEMFYQFCQSYGSS